MKPSVARMITAAVLAAAPAASGAREPALGAPPPPTSQPTPGPVVCPIGVVNYLPLPNKYVAYDAGDRGCSSPRSAQDIAVDSDMKCDDNFGCKVVMNPASSTGCDPLYYPVSCGQWLLVSPNPIIEGKITACVSDGYPGPNVECDPVDPVHPTQEGAREYRRSLRSERER